MAISLGESVRSCFEERAGVVTVAVGAMLLLTSVLFLGKTWFDEMVFTLTSLPGIVFLVAGINLHFESLERPFHSKRNLGMYLLSAAPILFVASIVSVVYGAKIVDIRFTKGGSPSFIPDKGSMWLPEVSPGMMIEVERPFGWLFLPLVVMSIVVLLCGTGLKLRSEQ